MCRRSFCTRDFNVEAKGLNLVGLKRAGFKAADVSALKTAYRLLYRSGLKLEDALERIETEVPTRHTRHLVDVHSREQARHLPGVSRRAPFCVIGAGIT